MRSLDVNKTLSKLFRLVPLSKEEARDTLLNILEAEGCSFNTAWGAYFALLDAKGPTRQEVEGLFEACIAYDSGFCRVPLARNLPNAVLVAGSGKDTFKTINISTLASLVAAGAGVPVVKMVSSSSSSGIGSRDLLDMIGIKILVDAESCRKALRKCGLAFIGIEDQVPQFNLRYQGVFFHFHTLSPYLGLMASPVQLQNIVLGLSRPIVVQAAEMVSSLGFKRVVVASTEIDSSLVFADEILPTGRVRYAEAYSGQPLIYYLRDGERLRRAGSRFSLDEVRERAYIPDPKNEFRHILTYHGEADSAQEVVCLNSASILVASGVCDSLVEGVAKSWKALCSGDALRVLDKYEEL